MLLVSLRLLWWVSWLLVCRLRVLWFVLIADLLFDCWLICLFGGLDALDFWFSFACWDVLLIVDLFGCRDLFELLCFGVRC